MVLIVAGMALMLVFAIGARAAQTGFGLGRRALLVADGETAQDDLRGIVRGLVLAPSGIDPASVGAAVFAGDERGFSAGAVLARAGVCAGAGPAGMLHVALASDSGGDVVTCQAGAGPKVTVADLRPRRGRFAYSVDGRVWSERWSPPPSWAAAGVHPVTQQRLFVRLLSDDGHIEVIERAGSGPPLLYPPPAPRTSPLGPSDLATRRSTAPQL